MILQHAVEAFWLAVKDLLHQENPADVRHITLQFLTSLVTGQVSILINHSWRIERFVRASGV